MNTPALPLAEPRQLGPGQNTAEADTFTRRQECNRHAAALRRFAGEAWVPDPVSSAAYLAKFRKPGALPK